MDPLVFIARLSCRSGIPQNVTLALEVHSQKSGMKNLITWFLNQVMLQEGSTLAGRS